MVDPVDAIAAALRALAPAKVTVGVRRIDEIDEATLFDDERHLIEAAVPQRRREFASGRVLLRELIGQHVPIPSRPDRAPDLPTGIVGSLAHDDEFVVAAIGRSEDVAALGVDIEPIQELTAGLPDSILRHDERELDPMLAFTLKEATYKAWSQLGGRFLEHHEVRLRIRGSSFDATVVTEGADLTGSFASASGRWLALTGVTR